MKDWLLNFHQLSGETVITDAQLAQNKYLEGLPFGYDTVLAKRYQAGQDPWDPGCKVTSLINGYDAMKHIRDALTKLAGEAEASTGNDKGHVCVTGWRINDFRDLTEAGLPADPAATPHALFARLIDAGVHVRVLVWYQGFIQSWAGGLKAHREDHLRQAQDFQKLLTGNSNPTEGIVGLDLRIGPFSGSHHQKMMVIRGPNTNIAFCGGVDLAYTRRDTPENAAQYDPLVPKFYAGDTQSGKSMPDHTADGIGEIQSSDLKIEVYGDGITNKQRWHDQHLQLEGPVVATLEAQFWERWIDAGRIFPLSQDTALRRNQVIFSTSVEIDPEVDSTIAGGIKVDPAAGESIVQMWRTIPFRDRGDRELFNYGEFTVMAGVANAVKQSRQLIWIFDQYFWSRPLGRLLHKQLKENTQLHVIIVLPPFADDPDKLVELQQHRGRRIALNDIIYDSDNNMLDKDGNAIDLRVGVYNLWDNQPGINLGIYCHAKAQMYDDALLVCGSANMNRRSFTSDTEIDCAVFDKAVVQQHRKKLWSLLFPDVQWIEDAKGITLDFNSGDAGKTFFTYFKESVSGTSKPFLIEDKWRNPADEPILMPNYDPDNPDENLKRYQYDLSEIPGMSGPDDPKVLYYDFKASQFVFDHFVDPSSIPLSIDSGNASLDEVVKRLYTPGKSGQLHYLKNNAVQQQTQI